MTHISFSEEATKQIQAPGWKHAGIAIGELTNKWSGRSDIICQMTEETPEGAPALFKPMVSEIHISTNQVFANTKPEEVGDLTDSEVQFEFPKAIGAVLHEALHARFSKWDIEASSKALNSQEFQALMMLEEGRIEARGVIEMPWGKNFLQACAMDLVIADSEESFKADTTIQSAANMVALVHARLMAGVLDESDCPDLVELIDQTLTPEVVTALREIIAKAQAHTNHRNPEELYKLARQWVKIVNKAAKEKGEPTPEEQQQAAEQFAKSMRKAMKEASESTQISNTESLGEQEQQQRWEEQVAASKEQASEKKKNEEAAKQVFSKSANGISGSRLVEERTPRPEERVAAVTISKMLEQAKYRNRSETEINSVTPPGRLRTRSMVQANAMKARGVMTEVEPWRKKVRKQTDDPKLTIGVMVDISGSMADAMEPMATTAWVLSEASRRVQGRTAMVYFGSSSFPTLKPGQHLDKVRVYSADDSTEEFDEAFRALDGSLNLVHGSDARLLVVVSDGYYRPDQRDRARHWVKKCEQAGVAVLWMPFSHAGEADRILRVSKTAQLLDVGSNPAAVAQSIGRAASTALSKVGSKI